MKQAIKRDKDGFIVRNAEVSRLEAFVDASFAFAMTLLVIFFNELPDTVAELRHALLRVPTFVVCFVLLATFWLAHNRWSRRFGLEDTYTTVLSLAFVLVLLVFVYPMRMVLSAFLGSISGGWLPSELGFDPMHAASDMQTAFIVYSIGVGSMSLILWLLNRHAWRQRDALSLDRTERILLAGELGQHRIQIVIALTSIVASLLILLARPGNPWLISLPMWLYAASAILLPRHWMRVTRRVKADAKAEDAPLPTGSPAAARGDDVRAANEPDHA